MYVSTKHLIDMMVTAGLSPEKIEVLLQVTASLRSNHGLLVKTSAFQEQIAAVDEDVVSCIRFLEKHTMLNTRSLKKLLQTVRSHPSYTTYVTSVKTSSPELIRTVFGTEDSSQMDLESSSEIGMHVERDGKIYKRNLKTDITTLLSNR